MPEALTIADLAGMHSNDFYALSDEEVLSIGAASDAYVKAEKKRHWSDQDNQIRISRNGRIVAWTPPREDDDGVMQRPVTHELRPACAGVDFGRAYAMPSMSLDRFVELTNRILIAHLHTA
jgi:hypothetical protein